MPRSRRPMIFVAILTLAVAGLAWTALREEPVPVELATLARGPMQVTVDADGKTRIREVYEVSAPITGTALRAPVRVGDAVTGGETVVAVVEPVAPSLLDSRSRAQAEAAVHEAEAALAAAEARVRQAGEDLGYTEAQFRRVETLVQRGIASVTQLEQASQQLSLKQAAHATAIFDRDRARSALARAEAALVQPLVNNGEPGASCCVELRAPISGRVLELGGISERPVTAGAMLVSIGQPEDLEIVADLLSSQAVGLAPGNRALVERWGGPGALEARLRSIDPSARTVVSAIGIEEQRVEAVFDLITPPGERQGLGDGFAVFLRIVAWEADGVLQVPLSALFRTGPGWAVYRAEDGVARLAPVEIGRRNDRMAEVRSGLEEGAVVVLHPADRVAEGTPLSDQSRVREAAW